MLFFYRVKKGITLQNQYNRTYIGRKSTKFQMNPVKVVGGVAETRSWLAKFKSAWAINPSKIAEAKF